VNTVQSIYSDVADFFVSQPTLEAIAANQVSPAIQEYVDELLERNREEGLTAEERLEMEKILAISHLMCLAKAKARLKLAGEANRVSVS
jgi:hypothetical protein